jgi:hypothetical protein
MSDFRAIIFSIAATTMLVSAYLKLKTKELKLARATKRIAKKS